MSKPMLAAVSLLAATLLLSQTTPDAQPFLEKPYLQIGDASKLASAERLVLLWHTANTPAQWAVEVRTSKDAALRPRWKTSASRGSDDLTSNGGLVWKVNAMKSA